ncbi:2-desacetyl-2-hydroxyethyl bacteriochlorophyllide A dehydrogenase [Jannaschia pagri]|uniref:2-desacetyl-2-hydroxyethyl bacteriochlorophyllide A dehydrogenase n=1 Tax=Jannaschia pagri TaxID=2829797 RepID=A0ABQ4NLE2_9RHOB|nr:MULTISPECIES: chlorophyll synthesis pathway protein BchC [unclassified Jannaschia]GIT91399.1 2-desacetyl-2-hydroxyethyl bacteriochlorophyllide A dehydrogenase [Jannaschia sp. AI_61]GIT95233.1 2-desacetyl-2-hydroxyethyl bacteriochlorophyllide A dehydrogenase [Jannaschia sp. AI_62]
MQTEAIIMSGPGDIALGDLGLVDPQAGSVVVDIRQSAISTGTEKLLWSGEMPPFPGMGYPLVPGYEAVGEVVEARGTNLLKVGDRVFVPGADCYDGARGLFGAAAARVVTPADRLVKVDPGQGAQGALLALAATARHAIAGLRVDLPELIVGHGAFGRLLARLTVAAGGAPTVWERAAERRGGAQGYEVIDPETDDRRDYRTIYDASGNAGLLNDLVGRLAKGGEIVLAGFYPQPVSFAYPPAFMREARFRISAEWTRDDLVATRDLVEDGVLSLDALITHTRPAHDAPEAYAQAFAAPDCLKMILDWEHTA